MKPSTKLRELHEASKAELRNTLKLFVKAGVLIQRTKDGKVAWMNSPDFDRKSPQEQEEVFNRIAAVGSKPRKQIGKKCSVCQRRFNGERGLSLHWGKSHRLADLKPRKKIAIDPNDPLAVLFRDIKIID